MKSSNIRYYLLACILGLNTICSNAVADIKFLEDNRAEGSYIGSGAVNAPQIGNLIDVPPKLFLNPRGTTFYWYIPSYYQESPPIYTNKRFDGEFLARKFRNSSFATENPLANFHFWRAAHNLKKRTNPRIIITGNGVLQNPASGKPGNKTFLFSPNELPTALRNRIDTNESKAKLIIRYMHGEALPVGFTQRSSQLGQVINSNILYHKHSENRQIVYAGADDGMLHAFNAETGEEEFAYLPSSILPNLNTLTTEAGYNISKRPLHTVDGKIRIYTIKKNGKSIQTILIGTLGEGLKGLYALDITKGGRETKILWELFSGEKMGHIEGSVEIAMSEAGSGKAKPMVFIGNGLGSTANTATLFGINIQNGRIEFERDVPNGPNSTTNKGLFAPALTDIDLFEVADHAYAADSSGQLTRFNLKHFQESGGLYRIYRKPNPSRTEFVSSKPAILRHPKGGNVVSIVTSQKDGKSTPEVVGIWSTVLQDDFTIQNFQNFDIKNAKYQSDGNPGRALVGDSNLLKVNWNKNSAWRINLQEGEQIRHQDAFQFNGRLYFSSILSSGSYHINRIGIIDPTWSACGTIIYASEGNGTDKQCQDQHFISEVMDRRLMVQPNLVLLNHTAFRPRKVEEIWREEFIR